VDSQSVKTTENKSVSGYDAGKALKGRKRHIMTDTCGHLIVPRVHKPGLFTESCFDGISARF
jgi:Transposase DDE domain